MPAPFPASAQNPAEIFASKRLPLEILQRQPY